MNKKSRYALITFSLLFVLGTAEILYLKETKSMSEDALNKKRVFISLSGLPDLAFGSENEYIRHRTLSNVFAVYSEDGSLRENSKMSFSTNTMQGLKSNDKKQD